MKGISTGNKGVTGYAINHIFQDNKSTGGHPTNRHILKSSLYVFVKLKRLCETDCHTPSVFSRFTGFFTTGIIGQDQGGVLSRTSNYSLITIIVLLAFHHLQGNDFCTGNEGV
jgi:hypothetical protein